MLTPSQSTEQHATLLNGPGTSLLSGPPNPLRKGVCPFHAVYFSYSLRIDQRSTSISPCTPPPPSTFLMTP
ncbi:hypothetical protein HaLaN_22236 [Haematococcus lacustris]|uniref:Uncharacterized protein n=1 Tax=Haematococcus lacustris TaxID=44745 RepID=A0A699ZXS1_HAELA|nr:hypothetical protein HaLaN_22236 [Haematococcus lacustris]